MTVRTVTMITYWSEHFCGQSNAARPDAQHIWLEPQQQHRWARGQLLLLDSDQQACIIRCTSVKDDDANDEDAAVVTEATAIAGMES